jgi:hypothetical protein
MKAINIIGIVLVALILVVLLVVASTGLIKIPILTSLVGADHAPNLGVKSDPGLFERMLEREGVTLIDPHGNYCLDCNIRYSNPGGLDIYVTSSELTSYLQATNNEKGPLKDIQVKLGNNNEAELGAYMDLKDRGVNFAGPIYAKGRIVKGSPTTLRLEIEKAKVGWVPVPGNYVDQGENELEDTINDQLAKMPGLNIETLDINDGLLHFKGEFPKTASAP